MYKNRITTENNKITLNLMFESNVDLNQVFLTVEQNKVACLNLCGIKIKNEEIEALSKFLKENDTLASLDLSKNNIGSEETIAIAEALKTNNTLTNLNLDDNNIGSKGAVVLFNSLKKNKTLLELTLNSNTIGNEGAEAVSELLKENTAINSFRIGGNEYDNKTAIAIKNALKYNYCITDIFVSCDGDVWKEIDSIIKRNKIYLTDICKVLIRNDIFILNHDLSEILDFDNEKYDDDYDLRIAIKQSHSLSSSLLKALLTGNIEDIQVKYTGLSIPYSFYNNENADKVIKKLDSFVNDKLFKLAGICDNFELLENTKNSAFIPKEIIEHIKSYMVREYDFCVKKTPQNNDVTDITTNPTEDNVVEEAGLIGLTIQEVEGQ